MKPIFRTAIITILPFILMIIINESFRFSIKEQPFHKYGFATINSANTLSDKCTWNCHNNTSYCKTHHVKVLKNSFSKTDQLYYGEIKLLRSTGNYGLANIAILVIFIPFLILYFFIKGLNISKEIQKLKQNGKANSMRIFSL
jgi:hypothetical protein